MDLEGRSSVVLFVESKMDHHLDNAAAQVSRLSLIFLGINLQNDLLCFTVSHFNFTVKSSFTILNFFF